MVEFNKQPELLREFLKS